jgi:hypothetical protein
MRIVAVFLTLVLAASFTLAQESVPPPPQPVADQAPAPPPQAVNPPAANGPSLEATLKFIQDKVNQQGKIVYVETVTDSVTGESVGENHPAAAADPVRLVSFEGQSAKPAQRGFAGGVGGGSSLQRSAETQVVAVDPIGALSFQEDGSDMEVRRAGFGIIVPMMADWTKTWSVYFKNIERLEVISATDYKHRLKPAMAYQDDPPYFELVVHLAAGKSVQRHIQKIPSGKHGRSADSDDSIQEFALHFRDEDTAGRAAKAMIHAIELCGGGSQPDLF